ncbi:MAG: 23S rRNA (guanosine(2251)-2'-O)-methyltransferase RlmB [bacterium]
MSSIVGGRNAVIEILKNDRAAIEKLLLAESSSGDRIEQARLVASDREIPIEGTTVDHLSEQTGGNHQGVAVVLEQIHPHTLEDLLRETSADVSRLFVLDQVQDPVNLGKIARTALYFGFDGIVKTKDRTAPLSRTVLETSVGAAARLPIAQVTNLQRAMQQLRDDRYWIVGTSLEADKPIGTVDTDRNLALVLGNEESGLRRLTREECDYLVEIPGRGDFDSLNVATAGSIAAYALNPQPDDSEE